MLANEGHYQLTDADLSTMMSTETVLNELHKYWADFAKDNPTCVTAYNWTKHIELDAAIDPNSPFGKFME